MTNTPEQTLSDLLALGEKALPGEWRADCSLARVVSDYELDGKRYDYAPVCDIRGWGHLTGKGHARTRG